MSSCAGFATHAVRVVRVVELRMSTEAASPGARWREAGDAVVGNLRDSESKVSLADVASDAASAAGLSFVASVNGRKSFSAAFGRRSLSTKLALLVPATEPRNGRRSLTRISVVSSKEGQINDGDLAEDDVKVVQITPNNFRVTSTCSRDFLIEPFEPFKMDQFLRTLLYEICPPFVNWFVVLFVEICIFRHTTEEAVCAASARGFTPLPGPLARVVSRVDPPDYSGNGDILLFGMFWFPVFAVAFSSDARAFVEPLELLPLSILLLCRVSVIACKYALLPSSYCGDVNGKIYGVITQSDMARTLVGSAWLSPKMKAHEDLLRQDVENACLEADVDLSETRIDVGSAEAATAVRARAGGVGRRSETAVANTPSVVSGKELLAAIVDAHIGRTLPDWVLPILVVGGVAYALVSPVCRGAVGVQMFGDNALSQATAATLFLSSLFLFLNNMVFTVSCAWTFRRQRDAICCLNDIMRFPGEPVANILPPSPKLQRTKHKKESRKNQHANGAGDEHGKKIELPEKEPPAVVAARAAAARGAVVLVDLKDPSSCLCWSLVRRALRRVGSSWARRMNLYSIVFLVAAFTCAGSLLVLCYGAETRSHRLTTAGELFYLAIVVSGLCSLTVAEGSAINDLVPVVRTSLKREVVAIAAQLAGMQGNGRERKQNAATETNERVRRDEREALTDALRLIERVEQYVHLEEEHSHPVEVFYRVPATTAAITFTVSSLLSMLLIAAQRWFQMTGSEWWSYGGANGEFGVTDPTR